MIKYITFGANCQFSTNKLMKILISKYFLVFIHFNGQTQMIDSFIHRCLLDLIGLNSITILVSMQVTPTAQFSSNPHKTNIS